ncbi:hypothetical protein [Streptomyces sp. NPDC005953]|uniref:hypothetical protein n=1 Tax=Streptomyces sp. NPDC005953 TaxID=3156719 RepID=UPI0033C2391B
MPVFRAGDVVRESLLSDGPPGARASVALAGADRFDTDNGVFFDRKGDPTRTAPVSYDTTPAGLLRGIGGAQLTPHTPSLPDPA